MPHAVASDGTRIAYQVSGEGPPLLLLAGQANNHHWWDRVRADFDTHFRAITVDYRGTGASDKPETAYSTILFADDVISVLDSLGVGRAHVYGTSMGGRVAQWVAVRHPERARALILGCTSPGGTHAVERSREVRASLAQSDPDRSRRALLELMYTPEWLSRNPGPYNTLGDPGMPARAKLAHLRASNGHDAWDALPSISAPTLVLHGTDDLLSPADNAPLLAERIPNSRVHLLPGARHAYFEEERTAAGAAAIGFLAER
ncbi:MULTISPECIES: alpha/beta fold hydrolase [unclassified Rhodococcus (in: high G+C Gram-positive bacteria)]|uniref:alpha/beta fold hydrolase n=1 Tax=unclassified Rhodococcus (in: high G+C Gram-positive bacteria) TaxID=192944 RepID=UPI0004963744|nr:alpha/beta fold hydrolase [Rhodococcus sp. DK17]